MGKLIYLMNVSLDGFVETTDKSLDWANVDEELHAWFAERQRTIDAEFYGRRVYELMTAYWPTAPSDPNATPATLEYAEMWARTRRIVFSSTLTSAEWNSRLATGSVEEELERARTEFAGDLGVAGPTLAAAFVRRDLVDAYELVVHPVVLGSGTPFFPPDVSRRGLRLVDTRRFASGVVHLGYERDRS
jgi:dihydrofolate reductase